jgi:hypothetical protein
LTSGLFLIYGLFTHPEYFMWAGLIGPLAILSPFAAVVLGASLIYGSFSRERLPSPISQSSAKVDDWIVEEAFDQGKSKDEEVAYCQRNLAPAERLLLIVASRGRSAMNRLVLTDRRLLLYPKGDFTSGISFDYEDIYDARKQRRRILTYLADLTISVKGRTIEFKELGTEWADEVLHTIKKMEAA